MIEFKCFLATQKIQKLLTITLGCIHYSSTACSRSTVIIKVICKFSQVMKLFLLHMFKFPQRMKMHHCEAYWCYHERQRTHNMVLQRCEYCSVKGYRQQMLATTFLFFILCNFAGDKNGYFDVINFNCFLAAQKNARTADNNTRM